MTLYRVDLQPVGRRVEIEAGETLLAAAQSAGVALIAVCGGGGSCATCRVRLAAGRLTPPSAEETLAFTPSELASGLRLACQASPLSDVTIEIPPESLTAGQRLQIEGVESALALDPPIRVLDARLPPPGLDDLRADDARLRDTLAAEGLPGLALPLPVLARFSDVVRHDAAWTARLALDEEAGRVVAALPHGAPLYGLAVDIGTTKLAAYLVSLSDGAIAARAGEMNPQIAYGEDVVARIAFANQGEEQRRALQTRLVETLNAMLSALCAQAGVDAGQVVDAVLVGNTAMHHLVAGLPVRQLGQAPYVAAVNAALDFPAAEVGLALAPGARIFMPPNIAGYVGADHIAMLLATGFASAATGFASAATGFASAATGAGELPGVTIALDIGTNTEITLAAGGRLWCCSCASGPAFEGAHISAGMRAAPGAIERVQRVGGEWRVATIDHQPAVGICGSGILDAVAEMLAGGVIDARGALRPGAEGVVAGPKGGAFRLASNLETGKLIHVTRADVHEIQLAKAAIRAGVEVLLLEAGVQVQAIDRLIVAGAFGTYLSLESALRVGLFPPLPLERFHQVGNAAGMGARALLVSRRLRAQANDLLRREQYVELTTHPAFTDLFVQHIGFEPLTIPKG